MQKKHYERLKRIVAFALSVMMVVVSPNIQMLAVYAAAQEDVITADAPDVMAEGTGESIGEDTGIADAQGAGSEGTDMAEDIGKAAAPASDSAEESGDTAKSSVEDQKEEAADTQEITEQAEDEVSIPDDTADALAVAICTTYCMGNAAFRNSIS